MLDMSIKNTKDTNYLSYKAHFNTNISHYTCLKKEFRSGLIAQLIVIITHFYIFDLVLIIFIVIAVHKILITKSSSYLYALCSLYFQVLLTVTNQSKEQQENHQKSARMLLQTCPMLKTFLLPNFVHYYM